MTASILPFLAGFFGVLLLPPARRGLRRLGLPEWAPCAGMLLLALWPAARFLGPWPATRLDRGLLLAAPLLLLGQLGREPLPVWRPLAGWVAAAAVLLWHGVAIDLERLRGGLTNPLLTLACYLPVAGGLRVAAREDPSRASGPLLLADLALLVIAGLTNQPAVTALALPLLGILLGLHLQLLPPAELDRPEAAVAVCGLLLAGLTLWTRYSDASRMGALAAPLLWALPGMLLLLDLAGRLPAHRPERELPPALALCAVAVGLATTSSPAGGLLLCGAAALASGWLLQAARRRT